MNLIFVRHGESLYNANDNVYGVWGSGGLTKKGTEQAIKAAKDLQDTDVDIIYTSPISRARETAGIMGHILDIPVIAHLDFRELQYGCWEGMTEKEVAKTYPEEYSIWAKRPADLHFFGRETLDELQERVLDGLNSINDLYNNVVIVTHVAVIRAALLYVNNMDLNEYRTLNIPNASPIVINKEQIWGQGE